MKKLAFVTAFGVILSAVPYAAAQEGTSKPGQTFESNNLIEPGEVRSAGQTNFEGRNNLAPEDNLGTDAPAQGRIAGQPAGVQLAQNQQGQGQGTQGQSAQTQRAGGQNQQLGGGQNVQSNDQNARGQNQQNIQSVISGKLIKGNQAEIELAQMALQRAEHEQVKQFAQKMIDDHSKVLERLTSLHTESAAAGSQNQGQSRAGQGQGATTENRRQDRETDRANRQADQGAEGAGRNAGQNNQTSDSPGERADDRQADRQERRAERQDRTGDAAGQQQTQGGNQQSLQGNVPGADAQNMNRQQGNRNAGGGGLARLTSIMEQACDNNLQMTKEMLEQHKGHEFDMAYIGQQTVAHTQMLAELKALDGVGNQQFQQIVRDARTSTEHHLEQAKSIAQELKKGS